MLQVEISQLNSDQKLLDRSLYRRLSHIFQVIFIGKYMDPDFS